MKETNNMELFESTPIPKAVVMNVLPAIVAMLMALVYNLADTFFVGQTHNDIYVAAVSLATPIFMIYMALGDLFGVGGTSVISRAMGEGKTRYAKNVSSFCFWSSAITGVLFSICIVIFMKPLLGMLGASAETSPYTRQFLEILAIGGPFIVISTTCSNIIRAEGKPKIAMTGTLVGNLINIVLDALFILVFGWGVAGAAIATVIGNIVGTLIYVKYLSQNSRLLSIHLNQFSARNNIGKSVLAIGIPASLAFVLQSVSQIIANNMISGYGDMAVAAFGVAGKVMLIITTIAIGAGQGIQPIFGYCVGAGKAERFHGVARFSIIFCTMICIVLTAICYVFSGSAIQIFLTDMSAYEYGVKFLRILLLTGWIFGIYYVFANALLAMGAAQQSLLVNISRQGVIYIPMLLIMNKLAGLNGLLWAQPLTDIISLIIVGVLYYFTTNKYFHKKTCIA